MLTNYLIITLRYLLKHKSYSLINIFGLSVGLVCCFLIFLYISDERSYDRFHKEVDSIYRLTMDTRDPDGGIAYRGVYLPPPLGEYLTGYFPEMEHNTRIAYGGGYCSCR